MKRIVLASVLLVVFTSSVRAGWIQNGVVEPPPPPPSNSTTTESEESDADSQDTEGAIVITILRSVLPLL